MDAIWVVPPALAFIGIAGYSFAFISSRRFDREHPHLSRKGLLEAEQRARASTETARRPAAPVPPFHPDEWRMQSARDALESERLDRSLRQYGEQRTRHAAQAEEPDSPPRG